MLYQILDKIDEWVAVVENGDILSLTRIRRAKIAWAIWDLLIRKMDKICEFCGDLRRVVYCKADAAQLCLPCDARIHSANALCGRHYRALLCELCGDRAAHVHCLDHQIFICQGCDQSLHETSAHHRKRAVKSYMGCPSVKDFSALWGFDFNELKKIAPQGQMVSTSSVAVKLSRQFSSHIGTSSLEPETSSLNSDFSADFEVGLSNQQNNVRSYFLNVLSVKLFYFIILFVLFSFGIY